ncbi:MAG: hypothetical protein QOJ54_1839 [Aliidongia sp.]|nr:hypothetical protein [Aliidongia sp.]
MIQADLAALIADTEAQLDAAQRAIGAGEFVDLADLLPRIDSICARALAQRDKPSADHLARIVRKLDDLQTALRAQIARLGVEPRPDPRRAAQTYRTAAGTAGPTDERK